MPDERSFGERPADERTFDVTPTGAELPRGQNPYAAPTTELGVPLARQNPEDDFAIWRYNNKLILRRGYELPDVCVRTNTLQDLRRKTRVASWTPSWVLLFFLLGCLPVLIASIITTKREKIRFSITQQENRRRQNAVLMGWLIGGGGLALVILLLLPSVTEALNQPGTSQLWSFGFVAALILCVAGLIVGSYVALPFRVVKITRDYVVLKKLPADFVNRFPAWPYAPV